MRINNAIVLIKKSVCLNGIDIDIYGIPPLSLRELLHTYGLASEEILGDAFCEFYTKVCLHQAEGGDAINQKEIVGKIGPNTISPTSDSPKGYREDKPTRTF